MAHLDLSALGRTIRLDLAADLPAEVEARVRDAWAGGTISATIPDAVLPVEPAADADRMLERLSVEVTLRALDLTRGSLRLFHAAGIAADDGRVAAFVGPSGRGKTTLSRTLGAHFGYVSDETVGVASDLTVLPYRKPLSIVREGHPKQQVAPGAAGLRDLPAAPLRLAALVLLDRQGDIGTPRIEPVPFDRALLELVPQMSYLGDFAHPLQTLAGLVQAVGGVRRVTYSEASDLVSVMDELLAPTGEPAAWRPALPVRGGTAQSPSGDVTDAVEADGIVAVYARGRVHILAGIAPAVWQGLEAGLDRRAIVEHVVEQHGRPPVGEATELVDAAIVELTREGLLRAA
ncbi:hypothetical protein [Microbacterium mangrovi]|uniref:hypothetical protein n=1 Tax=Microbacterium mangrovi TaxID=1348253 RepID=UPI00068B15CA|nr:hypothetical protein [Microbacterium mangrovi]